MTSLKQYSRDSILDILKKNQLILKNKEFINSIITEDFLKNINIIQINSIDNLPVYDSFKKKKILEKKKI